MTTTATTPGVGFTAERIRTLHQARSILSDMRDEATSAGFHAPSDVSSKSPRAQDWGQLAHALSSAEHAITDAMIVAEVNCNAGSLLGDD